jgi:acyl carrier protein
MAAGLDSLGSVELRNTLESSLALPLPPTLVMDYPTAAAIAAYAAAKLPATATQMAPAHQDSFVDTRAATRTAGEQSWSWFDEEAVMPDAYGSSRSDQLPSIGAAAVAVQPFAAVESEVAAAVASILGRSIGSGEGLMASGLDSLASVELQNVLQATYPVPLPATLALDYPSVTAIAGYIHKKLAAAAGAATQTAAAGMQLVQGRVSVAALGDRAEPLGVFGMAFVLPGAASNDNVNLSAGGGYDAISVAPLER